jgi:hypothetical protein
VAEPGERPGRENDNIAKEDTEPARIDPEMAGQPGKESSSQPALTISPEKLAVLRQKVKEWKAAGFEVGAVEEVLGAERPDPDMLKVRLEEFKSNMKRFKRQNENSGNEGRESENGSTPAKKLKKVVKVVK